MNKYIKKDILFYFCTIKQIMRAPPHSINTTTMYKCIHNSVNMLLVNAFHMKFELLMSHYIKFTSQFEPHMLHNKKYVFWRLQSIIISKGNLQLQFSEFNLVIFWRTIRIWWKVIFEIHVIWWRASFFSFNQIINQTNYRS